MRRRVNVERRIVTTVAVVYAVGGIVDFGRGGDTWLLYLFVALLAGGVAICYALVPEEPGG